MAYVDHAFSITDEDDLVGGAAGGRPRGAPVKEIAFAAALLAFGAFGVVAGLVMAANRVGGDRSHDLGVLEVIDGEPRFVLCNAVEKHHADLLVVGSHGYGAIKRGTMLELVGKLAPMDS